MDNAKPNSASNPNQVRSVISILVLVGLAWFFFGGGQEKMARNEMEKIENQVANDAVKQYEIAARSGDKMQMYVQAGFCTAAFLQAKDETNYQKWLDIEHKLGKELGMPEQ